MLRRFVQISFIPISKLLNDPDKVEHTTETEKKIDLSVLQEETGWDRVKRIFIPDEFGTLSIEASTILQAGAVSMLVGAIVGGIVQSKIAYLQFFQNNEATTFKSHLDAKAKLQEKVTIGFGKGAFRWGWRLTLFCTSFVGFSTVIQSYRGKSGIIEYVAAGGITGCLYKFNIGPRGWIVGAGLGSVLGLVCGSCTTLLLKISGVSMDEVRYWQYYWKNSRNEYIRKGIADYVAKENFAVIKLHDDAVGDAGKHIDNLDKGVDIKK